MIAIQLYESMIYTTETRRIHRDEIDYDRKLASCSSKLNSSVISVSPW